MSGAAFSRSPANAGFATLLAMLFAFGMANSPWFDTYWLVHHLPVVLQVGSFRIDKPLILWINDGLMVFFFLLIALELKREILQGSCRDRVHWPRRHSLHWAACWCRP